VIFVPTLVNVYTVGNISASDLAHWLVAPASKRRSCSSAMPASVDAVFERHGSSAAYDCET
jgi:hypothetical protein